MNNNFSYSVSWKQDWAVNPNDHYLINARQRAAKKQIDQLESQDHIEDVTQAMAILTEIKNKSS